MTPGQATYRLLDGKGLLIQHSASRCGSPRANPSAKRSPTQARARPANLYRPLASPTTS